MNKQNKVLILTFVMGLLATAVALPLLSASGFPSFDVLLVAMFGEGSILAIGLSLLLIILMALGVGKVVKSYS